MFNKWFICAMFYLLDLKLPAPILFFIKSLFLAISLPWFHPSLIPPTPLLNQHYSKREKENRCRAILGDLWFSSYVINHLTMQYYIYCHFLCFIIGKKWGMIAICLTHRVCEGQIRHYIPKVFRKFKNNSYLKWLWLGTTS